MIRLIDYEIITVLCGVVTIAGIIFKYAVLRPLENSIAELNKAVDRLRGTFQIYDDRLRLCEIQIAELNQRVRSNQHRLDALEVTHHEKSGH